MSYPLLAPNRGERFFRRGEFDHRTTDFSSGRHSLEVDQGDYDFLLVVRSAAGNGWTNYLDCDCDLTRLSVLKCEMYATGPSQRIEVEADSTTLLNLTSPPTTWTPYEIDLTSQTGVKTLRISVVKTTSSTSSSIFCHLRNIRLY